MRLLGGLWMIALGALFFLGGCASQVPFMHMVLDASNADWHPLVLETVLENDWRLLTSNEDSRVITAAQPLPNRADVEERRWWEFRYDRDRLFIRSRVETRAVGAIGWHGTNLVPSDHDYADEFDVRSQIESLAKRRNYVTARELAGRHVYGQR